MSVSNLTSERFVPPPNNISLGFSRVLSGSLGVLQEGCRGCFALTAALDEEEEEEEEDCVLLFAMAHKTRVIHFVRDPTHHTTTPTILSKKKVGPQSFIMHETTVLSGNLLNGKVLVQCTPSK